MTPSSRGPSNDLRRAGLTRDRVLGAAVQLADEEGLDGLSMRKLAKRGCFNRLKGARFFLTRLVNSNSVSRLNFCECLKKAHFAASED